MTFALNDGDGTANSGHAVGNATATIGFSLPSNAPPVLTGDLQGVVTSGGTYVIATSDLFFADPDDTAAGVTFTASGVSNGAVVVNGTAAATFTGQQLAAGQVAFRHDGSPTTQASFSVTVEDGNEDGSPPVAQSFVLTVGAASAELSLAGAVRGVNANLTAGTWSLADKVLPLGDSITNGDAPEGQDEHGYRGHLWFNMIAQERLIDLVGPNSNGNVPDPDHAANPLHAELDSQVPRARQPCALPLPSPSSVRLR